MLNELQDNPSPAESGIDEKMALLEAMCAKKEHKQFWEEVNSINAMLNAGSLGREQKNDARSRINILCLKVKEEQQEIFAQAKEESKRGSREKVAFIMNMLQEALASELSPDGIQTGMGMVERAQAYLRSGKIGELEGYMLREDKDECFEKLREAKEDILSRRAKLKEANYRNFKKELDALSLLADNGDPYSALDEIKAARSRKRELLMDSAHYDEINTSLNNSWEKAIGRINVLRDEKADKHRKWRGDMQSKITQLKGLIEKNTAYIENLENQLEDLHDKLPTTLSTIHRERMEGWILEKERKIEDVTKSNIEIQEKIIDIKSRLDESKENLKPAPEN
jgi:hypothetical protein